MRGTQTYIVAGLDSALFVISQKKESICSICVQYYTYIYISTHIQRNDISELYRSLLYSINFTPTCLLSPSHMALPYNHLSHFGFHLLLRLVLLFR